jgi:cell division septal protein FtsQ
VDEENKPETQEIEEDPVKLVKRVRKSRKLRQGRRRQSGLRKTVRFFVTIILVFLLVYVSKMPQWYLPENAFTTANQNVIKIENNRIVKSYRIMALLKVHEIPHVPIYAMQTKALEKEIKTLKPIKDVYIRRYAFPARLHIIIKERKPIISVCLNEKAQSTGAYTQDGIFIGREFMPLSSEIKTIKVLSLPSGEFSYSKWDLEYINKIKTVVNYIESYSNEPIEYIDLRNPADVYVKIKTVSIRLGKLDNSVYERIKRLPSILPRIKLMRSKVQYVDISWEKVNYLKLYK